MASPTHSSRGQHRVYSRRSRRSSFNGARQFSAARAKSVRMLVVVGLLVAGLLAAIGTIAFHLMGESGGN